MQRIITAAAFALFILLAAAPARADDAAKVFDQLFAPRIKAVVASLDKADDHVLVAELTRLASDASTDEALAIIMFTQAYELAMRDVSGARLAADAMAALASRAAAQRAFATEKRIDALNLLLLRGKPEERDNAGGEMVDLLTELGDTQAGEGRFTDAAATYRRAILVTGRIKSRSGDDIKPRMETVLQQARAARQVEISRTKLLENRNDTATAEALVKIYLTELDDPKAATEYLDIVKDETLKTIATLAVKSASELSAAEAMTLAQWYYAQSRDAKGLAEGVTLGRAKESLERFLSVHTATDLARSKAMVMKGEVEKRSAQDRVTVPVGRISSAPKPPSKALLRGAILLYSFEKPTLAGPADRLTIRDLSEKACDGAVNGPVPVEGIAGGALSFDGKDDFITIQNLDKAITADLRAITVVGWIKTEPIHSKNFIFDIGFHSLRSLTFMVERDRVQFHLVHDFTKRLLVSPAQVTAEWHHAACVWTGDERVIFLDGRAVARDQTPRMTLNRETILLTGGNGGPPRIGSQAKPFLREGRYFNGLLDEFAVFSRTLSEQEIKAIHEAGKAGIHFGQYK